MKLWKRSLALLMALFLLVPTMPKGYGVVFAEEEETEEETQYTVTFSANGGTFNGEALSLNEMYSEGEYVSLPEVEPTREGYVFEGWSEDASAEWGDDYIEDYQVYSDMTFYAIWKDPLAGIEELTLDQEAYASYNGDDWKTFTFTAPEDGVYFFISRAEKDEYGYCDCDPYAELRNEEYMIAENDNGYDSYNFLIRYEMVQGETVYLYAHDNWGYDEGFPVIVTKGHLVTITAHTSVGQFSDGSQSITFSLLEGQNVDHFIPELPVSNDEQDCFSGWSDEPDALDANSEILASEGLEVYAVWRRENFLIYHPNGGYFLDEFGDTYDKYRYSVSGDGTYVEEPFEWNYLTVKNDDRSLIFQGWSFDPDATEPMEDSWIEMNDQNQNVFAVWMKGIKVTFDPQGGELTGEAEQYVRPGTQLQELSISGKKIVDDVEYGIIGWSTIEGADAPNVEGDFTFTEETTLFAVWAPMVWVHFSDGTESVQVIVGRTYSPLELASPDSYGGDDQYFAGWSKDPDATYEELEDLVFTKDTTVYPVWRGAVTVTYHTEYGHFYNEEQEYQITYRPGEEFWGIDVYGGPDYWSVIGWQLKNGDTIDEGYVVNKDMDVYAVWREPTTYIMLNANGGFFDGDPKKTTKKAYYYEDYEYIYLETEDIPEDSDHSKVCIGWSTDPNATVAEYRNYLEINVSDITAVLYAVWAPAYKVTFTTSDITIGKWTINGEDTDTFEKAYLNGSWIYNSDYNPTVVSDRYAFGGWSKTEGAIEPDESIIINGPTTLYAVWEEAAIVTIHQFDGDSYDEDDTYDAKLSTKQTLKDQGLLDHKWNIESETDEWIFLIGYATEPGGPVVYGPDDYVDGNVTDLYEIWETFSDAGYPYLKLNEEVSFTLTENRTMWYSFTPSESGAYSIKITTKNCRTDGYNTYGGNNYYSTWRREYGESTDTTYLTNTLTAGKPFYVYTDIMLYNGVDTAEIQVEAIKTGKVIYYVHNDATQVEIVPAGLYPQNTTNAWSDDSNQVLAGWARTENASRKDIINVRQIIVNADEEIELYPVWETIGENATALTAGQTQSFSVSTENTWFSFVPEETRPYVLILKKGSNSSSGFYDDDLDVGCYDNAKTWIYTGRSSSWWGEALYIFDDTQKKLVSGKTYYFKVAADSEDTVDWTICIEPAQAVYLYGNGGSFYSDPMTEGFVIPGSDRFIDIPEPFESGKIFVGWSSDPNATEADVDLSGESDVSWIKYHDEFYAVWKDLDELSRPLKKNVSDTRQGIKPRKEYYYSFTPEVSGNYAFRFTGSWYRFEAFDEDLERVSWDSYGELRETNEHYLVLPDLEAGKKYYFRMLWAEDNFSETAVCSVVDAYKITFHAGTNGYFSDYYYEEEMPTYVTYFVKGEQIFSIYNDWRVSRPQSHDADLSLAGWTTKETGQEVEELSQYQVNGDTDFYAVWENFKREAITVQLDKELSVVLKTKNQYYAFTPQKSGYYVLTLEQETPYTPAGSYWYFEGSLSVNCLDSDGNQVYSRTSSSGHYACNIIYNRFEAGQTYYFKLSDDDNENGVASKLQITYAKHIILDGNGGLFWNTECTEDGYLFGSNYWFDIPRHPQQNTGITFAGWATNPKATKPNVDLKDPSSTATIQDGDTLYAVWIQGVKVTYKTDFGTWEGFGDLTEISVYYTPGTPLYDGNMPRAINHPDGDRHEYVYKDKAGNMYHPDTLVNQEVTLYPVWVSKSNNVISQSTKLVRSYSSKNQYIQLAKTAKYESAGLTYKISGTTNKSVKVSTTGKLTIPAKFSGKFTVTITSKETENYKSTKKTVTVYVPTKPTISSATNSASKTMLVKWKAATIGQGYKVQYSTSSKFSKPKTVTVKGRTTVKATIKKLTKGKTYYVRVRSYYKVGTKYYYSGWSATKKVVIKK